MVISVSEYTQLISEITSRDTNTWLNAWRSYKSQDLFASDHENAGNALHTQLHTALYNQDDKALYNNWHKSLCSVLK